MKPLFVLLIFLFAACKPKPDPGSISHPRDAYAWGDARFGIPKDSLESYGIPGVETIGLNRFMLTGSVHDSVGLWQVELRNIGVSKVDEYELDNYKKMLKALDTVVSKIYGEGKMESSYPSSDFDFENHKAKTFKTWKTAAKRITLSVEKGNDGNNCAILRVTNDSLSLCIFRIQYREEEKAKDMLKRMEKVLIDEAAKKI